MTTLSDPSALIGLPVLDRDGDKIGKVGQVYLDDDSGQPLWVAISNGLFGTKTSFAPLAGATDTRANLRLAVEKDRVKNAPNIDTDVDLSKQDQSALYDYYADNLPSHAHQSRGTGREPRPSSLDVQGSGKDVSGPATDSAMTRSQEQVHVGTERVATGRARLRKYVVTEYVTQTVLVSHEEVRVGREPITEANVAAAIDGPNVSEAEHELTLSAERPVMQKATVPVERVRLATETVTDQHTVEEDVRKEQIEVDQGANRRGSH